MFAFKGRHYISGDGLGESGTGMIDVLDPSYGSAIGIASDGSAALDKRAVHAARVGLEETNWAFEPQISAQTLMELAATLEACTTESAEILTKEPGRVLSQAMDEVAKCFGEAHYYAGVACIDFGRTFESGQGKLSLTTREPVGVVSVIAPWNAPVKLLVRSVAPAFAAGCSVVIKPAPQMPLTNAVVIECFDASTSLPKEIVNSVNKFVTEVGHILSTHRKIDVISFTGFSKNEKNIMAKAAESISHVSRELRGKAPAFVFPEADLSRAVHETVQRALAFKKQMCICISRILIHGQAYNQAKGGLQSAFSSVVVGDPPASGVGLGPLIDKASRSCILFLIDRASDGAVVVTKGDVGDASLASENFVSPTRSRPTTRTMTWCKRSSLARLFRLSSSHQSQALWPRPIRQSYGWQRRSTNKTWIWVCGGLEHCGPGRSGTTATIASCPRSNPAATAKAGSGDCMG